MPVFDLLELFEEVHEMIQEKNALYGDPVSSCNPYSLDPDPVSDVLPSDAEEQHATGNQSKGL